MSVYGAYTPATYMQEAGVDPAQVVAEAGQRVAAISDVAQDVFRNYFQHCGLQNLGCRSRPEVGAVVATPWMRLLKIRLRPSGTG